MQQQFGGMNLAGNTMAYAQTNGQWGQANTGHTLSTNLWQ